MISDSLRSLNIYQIKNNIITTSDRNMYLYYHTYKDPTAPSSQNICLNYFTYLQYISHLPAGSRRHIYSGAFSNHNIVTTDQVSSSHVFVNNCSNIPSSYS